MTATSACRYPWCPDDNPAHIDHVLTKYVRVSQPADLAIGAGVWTDDNDPSADVVIHLDDQRRIDTQATLTLDQARELHAHLGEAIDNAIAAGAVQSGS